MAARHAPQRRRESEDVCVPESLKFWAPLLNFSVFQRTIFLVLVTGSAGVAPVRIYDSLYL